MIDHHVYAYLVYRAHLLRKVQEEEQARGRDFVASPAFAPLGTTGLRAHAQIVTADGPPTFVVRIRKYLDSRAEPADLARLFFTGEYTRLPQPVMGAGYAEHVFFSEVIPPCVVPT